MAIDVQSAVQAYWDNSDYDVTDSVAKCKLFIAACRQLLGVRPDEAQQEDERYRYDQRNIRAELERALAWLAANEDVGAAASGSVKHLRLAGWRGESEE